MKDSPSPDNYRGGGNFFNTVDTILAKSRKNPAEPISTLDWMEQAKHLACRLTIDTVLGGSNTLLDEHPCNELSALLQLPSTERRERLETIRRHRRMFLVARDGIILSTDKHQTEEFQSLRRLCFALGRYADSDGQATRHATTAHESLEGLQQARKEAETFKHSNERLRAKYLVALDNMGDEAFYRADVRLSFHQRRKNFRRAVNTLVLFAAHKNDRQTTRLAEVGLIINTSMGRISDRIDSYNTREARTRHR